MDPAARDTQKRAPGSLLSEILTLAPLVSLPLVIPFRNISVFANEELVTNMRKV